MCSKNTKRGGVMVAGLAAVDGGLSEGTSWGQHLAGQEPALDDLGETGCPVERTEPDGRERGARPWREGIRVGFVVGWILGCIAR